VQRCADTMWTGAGPDQQVWLHIKITLGAGCAPAPREQSRYYGQGRRWIAPFGLSLSVAALLGWAQAHGGSPASPSRGAEISVIVPPLPPSPRSTLRRAPKPVSLTQSKSEAPLRDKRVQIADRASVEAPLPASALQSPSRARASMQAAHSGAVETWSEGQIRGYAAAGLTIDEDNRSCREIFTWERGGEQGEARSELFCDADSQNKAVTPAPKS
jgi:hypothetical protein